MTISQCQILKDRKSVSTFLKTGNTFATTELQEQTPLYSFQSMILGHKYAPSCEIEVAAKLFHRQNNVWLECKNSDNIIPHVLTIFESDTLTHDQPLQLMLRYQHYQYLTPRSNLVTNDVPSDQICGKINTK